MDTSRQQLPFVPGAPEPTMLTAEQAGRNAFRAGVGFNECTYPKDDRQRRIHWEDGWMDEQERSTSGAQPQTDAHAEARDEVRRILANERITNTTIRKTQTRRDAVDISRQLFQFAGFFEKYKSTGGVISPSEAQYLTSQFGALAEAAKAQSIAHKAVCDEFDAFIETSGAPVDRRPVRAFSVIEGGVA